MKDTDTLNLITSNVPGSELGRSSKGRTMLSKRRTLNRNFFESHGILRVFNLLGAGGRRCPWGDGWEILKGDWFVASQAHSVGMSIGNGS